MVFDGIYQPPCPGEHTSARKKQQHPQFHRTVCKHCAHTAGEKSPSCLISLVREAEIPDADMETNQGAAVGARGSLAPGQAQLDTACHPALGASPIPRTKQQNPKLIPRDFAGEIPAQPIFCLQIFDHVLSSYTPPCKHSSAPHLSASWPVLSRHF